MLLRFLFEITAEGSVLKVMYSPDGQKQAVDFQKGLVFSLSNRLMISDEQLRKQKAWAYKINETGAEGNLISTVRGQTRDTMLICRFCIACLRQDNVYSPPQNEYKNTNTISKDKKNKH